MILNEIELIDKQREVDTSVILNGSLTNRQLNASLSVNQSGSVKNKFTFHKSRRNKFQANFFTELRWLMWRNFICMTTSNKNSIFKYN
jgi:hypothetical protein